MNHARVLYQFKECAGKSFRPSNGTEGMMFDDAVCAKCVNDAQHRITQKGGCTILGRAMAFNTTDDGYPPEWRFNDEGWPTCLAFDPVLSPALDTRSSDG